jgi:hypothetical protein
MEELGVGPGHHLVGSGNDPDRCLDAWQHVRFGSKADIARCQADVRFTPKSGHRLSLPGCPLCHRRTLQDLTT